MSIGGSVYLQSGDLPPDWDDVSKGYFCSIAVVPIGTYPNDSAAIYVDGKKMPFVPMRGSIAGYRQRSQLQRVNEWQIKFCGNLGVKWGRIATQNPAKRVMCILAGEKIKRGFLGLNATCRTQILLDEVIGGVYRGSGGMFRSICIYDSISDCGQWLGSCGVLSPCQALRSAAREVAETIGGTPRCA